MDMKLQPTSVIAESVIYFLDRTILLNSFPRHIKQEIARELERKAAACLKRNMEHEPASMMYALTQALRKMPLFSAYSESASDDMVHLLVDICYDSAIQRTIKVNQLL